MDEWGKALENIELQYENLKILLGNVDADCFIPRSCRQELRESLHEAEIQLEKVMKCISYAMEFNRRFR